MKRRVLCLILALALALPLLSLGVRAEEYPFYRVRIDAGNGPIEEQAILSEGEIYIPAESFGRYTYFEFHPETNTFLMEGQEENRAFKKVIINPETKRIGTMNRIFDLKDCFVVNGTIYLPFCQMLPILNGQILAAGEGTIFVTNPKVTLAGALYDFYINDYFFNLYDEFYGDMESGFKEGLFKKILGKGGLLVAYMLPSYVFNTVADFRLDRLDLIFNSGTFEDYREIMTDYLRNDSLFLRANEAHDDPGLILGLINFGSEQTEMYKDAMDWMETIEKIDLDKNKYLVRGAAEELVRNIQEVEDLPDYAYGAEDFIKVWHDDSKGISFAEAFELFEYIYVYHTHTEDNRKMLDAVYNITAGGDRKDVQYRAAKAVYDLYGEKVLPALAERIGKEYIKEYLEKTAVGVKLKPYELTAKVSGAVWELVIPGDTKDVSVLTLHAGVADSARMSASDYNLNTEAAVEDYRLSLLLMMLASRKCYQIMADVAEGYGQNAGEYKAQVEKLEARIMALYLAAGNLRYEAFENFAPLAEENRKLLQDADFFATVEPLDPGEVIATEPAETGATEPPAAQSGEECYAFMDFLADNPVYQYFTLLDINKDGCMELIAMEAKNPGSHSVDLYVYRNRRVELGFEDIWGTDENLYYNPNRRWLESVTMDGGEGGVWFYSLDDTGNVIEQSFTESSYSGKWYNGSPARDTEALNAWQALKDKYDPASSMVLVFTSTRPEEEFEVTAGELHYYFLAEHPEYNYYALLDINGDGTDELLVSETDLPGDQQVDIWVNQGGIYVPGYENICARATSLTYNPYQKWVENVIVGAMGGGVEFFCLDGSGNVIRESFEHYEWCGGLYNGEPADDWEDYMAYQRLEEAYDPEQSREIVFQPAP